MIELTVAFWALLFAVITGSAFAWGVFAAMALILFLWLISDSREVE